jgi:hypothetical protein
MMCGAHTHVHFFPNVFFPCKLLCIFKISMLRSINCWHGDYKSAIFGEPVPANSIRSINCWHGDYKSAIFDESVQENSSNLNIRFINVNCTERT